ncbi:response regulator transcription factor [Hymenobacter sp. BT18]|uniref:helix-turn-helix transcriptional regulator n=1 Tax=Hymenobacter sp. BT18 TaxID=2835648 RepID=UPI00143EBFBA|nr:LuxR C-terminal-related transcriptional regulator [Hymenobacter sp. BT18]QIX62269.1 response regulator transcription factor [Hymenobacter sp. BT18]
MIRLRHADFLRLNQAIELVHAEAGPRRLFGQLSRAVMLAISAETVCFDGYDLSGRIGHLGAYPEGLFVADDFPLLGNHIAEHPLFPAIMEQRRSEPLRTSDFCRMPQYFRTTLFNSFYRPLALTHHMILGLELKDYGWVTCALARQRRNFTEADRQVLHLLKPHMQVAVRHARTVARLQSPPPAAPEMALLTELTARETHVLTLLSRGLTDKEIGQQSGISTRTVQNHLQNIYSKLGVTNRTAALGQVLGRGAY